MEKNAKEYHLKIIKRNSNFKKIKVLNSKTAYDYMMNFYGDDLLLFESFFILTLNRRNEITGYAKISQGGVHGTVVDNKIIAKYAIDSLSSGIILGHNHPSGELTPSEADITITRKLKEGLKFLDINVLDHIILTENGFYSFADEQNL